jgi:hypothetical protein
MSSPCRPLLAGECWGVLGSFPSDPKLGSVIVLPPLTDTPGSADPPFLLRPTPPGPGSGEIPARARGSEPWPFPSLLAPEPSPAKPLPGPFPRPMPEPPPDPPKPELLMPAGDTTSEPVLPFPGIPTFGPGWLETTIPLSPPLPPPVLGGATAEPMSKGPPEPAPLLPKPRPPAAVPPASEGGGGTMLLGPSRAPGGAFNHRVPPSTGGAITEFLPGSPPTICLSSGWLPACTGGGTTLFSPGNPPPSCLSNDRVPAGTGGGTTPGSVIAELANEPIWRVTCVGGGAITLGGGSSSLAFTLLSRSGADTGGGTTNVLLTTSGTRMSRGAPAGAGGTTPGSIAGVRRLFRTIGGAGAITGAVKAGARIWSRTTSGVGGTTLIAGSVADASVDFRPSVGAAPAIFFTARRFATGVSDRGRSSLGASTTVSLRDSPRATRMVCVW